MTRPCESKQCFWYIFREDYGIGSCRERDTHINLFKTCGRDGHNILKYDLGTGTDNLGPPETETDFSFEMLLKYFTQRYGKYYVSILWFYLMLFEDIYSLQNYYKEIPRPPDPRHTKIFPSVSGVCWYVEAHRQHCHLHALFLHFKWWSETFFHISWRSTSFYAL